MNRGVLRITAVLTLIACCDLTSASGGMIGIDDARGQGGTLASHSRFASLRGTITTLGHTLVPLTDLSSVSLTGLDAIILGMPFDGPPSRLFSAGDIQSIHGFVDLGGGLMILADGATGDDASNLNLLTEHFGVLYSLSTASASGRTVTSFVDHPVTDGVLSAGVDFQKPLTSIMSPAVDLTINAGADNIVAAVTGSGGAGNAVFLSDSTIFSDSPTADRNIGFGDNQRLLENSINFVTANPVPEPCTALLLGIGAIAIGVGRYRRAARLGRSSRSRQSPQTPAFDLNGRSELLRDAPAG